MRRLRKILITAGLVVLWAVALIGAVLAEATWFAEPPADRGDLAAIEHHLTQEIGDAASRRRLGSATLVLVQNGEIVAEHGFGIGDVETGAPVACDRTLFVVGSVSKAVTAWGVMKLVEQGAIGLDEPVMRHLKRWQFPGSEAHRDRVTVRHLLSHTSGIDDLPGYAGFLPGQHVQTLEESLTLPADPRWGEARGVRIVRPPGAMMYSTTGYAVLQLLVEEVTQRPFAEYMKEAVLQPLGMTQSSFDLDTIVSEGRERDIAPNFDADLKTEPRRRYAAPAGVALYTTGRDLGRFLRAFSRDNPVLERETLNQMWSPQPGTAGTWGLGLELYVNNAFGNVVGHGGGVHPAWGALIRVNPKTGNGLVMTISGGQGTLNQLVHDWVYWETGEITSEARLQIVQDRAMHALIVFLVGGVAIVVWSVLR